MGDWRPELRVYGDQGTRGGKPRGLDMPFGCSGSGIEAAGAGNLRYLNNQGIRLDRDPYTFLEEALDYNPTLIVLDSLTRLVREIVGLRRQCRGLSAAHKVPDMGAHTTTVGPENTALLLSELRT